MTFDLLKALEERTRPADLYGKHVAKRPTAFVDTILAGLASKNKRVQGGCAELASRLSADHPELLYPHMDILARSLKARAPILRWEAACTLGNLAAVDEDRMIADHVNDLIALLPDKSIVLQGHAVRALAKVARRHTDLAPKIWKALLAAEPQFPGTRVGYLIEAAEALVDNPALARTIRPFVARHAAGERAVVARKANKVLKQLELTSAAKRTPRSTR